MYIHPLNGRIIIFDVENRQLRDGMNCFLVKNSIMGLVKPATSEFQHEVDDEH
jgi:hypothetical protein